MVRVRVEFQKTGPVRFSSHRDTMRIFRRAFAAGGVPVAHTQGYNPHPRFSFGPSLRTGWEGLREYLDTVLNEPVPDLAAACNPYLPEGLEFTACAEVAPGVPKLSRDVVAARYSVIIDAENIVDNPPREWTSFVEDLGPAAEGRALPHAALEDAIGRRFGFTRPGDAQTDKARERVPSARSGTHTGAQLLDVKVNELHDGGMQIEYSSSMREGKSYFPEEILSPFLGDVMALPVPQKVTRKALYVQRMGEYLSPISKGVVQEGL